MTERSNPTPRFGWLAGTGTILAIAACYGTLATVTVLSLLGVTLVINPGLWAGAISLFALLALAGVAMSYPRHRTGGPVLIGALGAALVLWAMFGSYSRIVELIGFAGLMTAAIWDWRLKRCESPTESAPGVAKRPHVQQKEGER